jgi:hypothetical protein
MQPHANRYIRVNKLQSAFQTIEPLPVEPDSQLHVPKVDPCYGDFLWNNLP